MCCVQGRLQLRVFQGEICPPPSALKGKTRIEISCMAKKKATAKALECKAKERAAQVQIMAFVRRSELICGLGWLIHLSHLVFGMGAQELCRSY